MAITGINNSSYTSYYASNYKNTVKKTDSEKDSTCLLYTSSDEKISELVDAFMNALPALLKTQLQTA